jgi:protein-L-isoaspartate O-methyltransferase
MPSHSPKSTDHDYVLGTNRDELERLGLQHRLWRPHVLDVWQRAGIGPGRRVIDVGAGPGYATVDLAQVVGPAGHVLALERSERFAAALRGVLQERALHNVTLHEIDLMEHAIPATGYDAAWCRWVACFVSSPQRLVQSIHAALRMGGTVTFHEYSDYASMRLAPRRPAFEAWVAEVKASWRASGGEPDVALDLVGLLKRAGFTISHARPIAFAARPSDPFWQWPASFIHTNLDRLLELGRVDAAWCDQVRAAWAEAEADAGSVVVTPLVLELVAVKTA